LAYGTKNGHIKMLSLQGFEQEVYSIFGPKMQREEVPIEFVLFVPGQLLMLTIDAHNRLAFRDLRSENEDKIKRKNPLDD
jgi:hypothetical protein